MKLEKVKITSVAHGGRIIEGTLILPENLKPKNPAILFIHGWRSSEEGYIPRAKAMAEFGFICLTFNLSGHGASEGDIRKLTRKDYLNDILTAYDYLKNLENVDEDKIGVVGGSFGGYLASILTRKCSIKWLVLRAPANYINKGFEDLPQVQYPEKRFINVWKQTEHNYHETVSLESLHEYPHKVLIVESEKDEMVPHQTIMSYVNAVKDKSKLKHIVMEGADHAIHSEKYQQEFINILKEWFGNKL